MSGANSLDLQAFSPDDMATRIVSVYEEWDNANEKAKKRWEEVRAYKYATSTMETSNAGVGGFSSDPSAKQGWSHSTHIPKICQISDNLNANYYSALFSVEKWVEFQGMDRAAVVKDKREAVEAYILTKCRINNFKNEIRKCLDDWGETGNCFGTAHYQNQVFVDPDTGEKSVAYQGPVFSRISPYDIVFNPLATSFERSPKILCSIMTIGELLREVEDNPEKGYLQEAVTKAKDLRAYTLTAKDRYINKFIHIEVGGYGSAYDYLKSGHVEILDFYGDFYNDATGEFLKNHVITVLDRRWILRSEPIKSYDGTPYIYHCGWRNRSESLWAMGPLENLIGMQYMINHLQNTKADAFDEFVVPTVVTAGDVTQSGEKFGGLLAQSYHIDGADGSVNFLRPDASFLQANMDIQYLEALMEMYAGSPREAMGIRTPGEKTAFEVEQLSNAAYRIFQHKIEYFSEQFMEKAVNGMVEVARRNISGEDIVQTTDDDFGAQKFITVTKEDLKSNGRIVPVGARHHAEKARLAQTLGVMNQQMDPEMRMHISSIDMAHAMVAATDTAKLLPVKPYIRLSEQQQAQALNNQMTEDRMVAESEPL